MFTIEKTNYGFKISFYDIIEEYEIKRWLKKSEELLENVEKPFTIYIDMSEMVSVSHPARKLMIEGQKKYKQAGMIRSAVILHDPVTAIQFRKVAKESGIGDWERYFDITESDDYKQRAMEWLVKGVYKENIKNTA